MAAFIPFENESLAGICGGALPPFLTPNSEGTIDITDPGPMFDNDLSSKDQVHWAGQLVSHPTIAQLQPAKEPVPSAWRQLPGTYLSCKNDQALPVQVQETMVDRLNKLRRDCACTENIVMQAIRHS